MKIRVDKNVVEFHPGNEEETKSLEVLWRVVVDCMKENKKMVAIGEYVPTKENIARFFIEGVTGGETKWSEEVSAEDCTYLCEICNKYMNVKAGQNIPYCCGRIMEGID
jgi:hypothetical protein